MKYFIEVVKQNFMIMLQSLYITQPQLVKAIKDIENNGHLLIGKTLIPMQVKFFEKSKEIVALYDCYHLK